MMLLVGSRALQQYIEPGRVLHDWDIWMTDDHLAHWNWANSKYFVKETPHSYIYDIGGEIVEITTVSKFTLSDKAIFSEETKDEFAKKVKTPCGMAFVPSIQSIYEMKAATAMFIHEPKHQFDLEKILKNFPSVRADTIILKGRIEETEARVKKSQKKKYDFFHKYQIPEYIYHDDLHVIFADLMGLPMPTYQRITTGETDISKNLFDKLTHEQKVSLMTEESLVLSLERWFIPQMVEKGINYRLVDMFYNNNEASPTYHILKHCCITGLKGEADYITSFSRTYFFEIEKKWQEVKALIKEKGGFPDHFYKKLFELRKRYKNGEKVVII